MDRGKAGGEGPGRGQANTGINLWLEQSQKETKSWGIFVAWGDPDGESALPNFESQEGADVAWWLL